MKILAIDTSSIVSTIAIIEEEKLIAEKVMNTKKTHSETLMPMVEEIFKDANMELEEMDAIVVTRGPGSFTGLRIGVATAKGLAFSTNKPLVGISTLQGLAYNLPYSQNIVCSIMDAKRNQVYAGIYQWHKDHFISLYEENAMDLEDLVEKLKEIKRDVTFVGDGILTYKEKIKELLKENAHFAPSSCNMQRASSIGFLGIEKVKNKEFEDIQSFSPVYFRKSQAEREYDEKKQNSLVKK